MRGRCGKNWRKGLCKSWRKRLHTGRHKSCAPAGAGSSARSTARVASEVCERALATPCARACGRAGPGAKSWRWDCARPLAKRFRIDWRKGCSKGLCGGEGAAQEFVHGLAQRLAQGIAHALAQGGAQKLAHGLAHWLFPFQAGAQDP